MTKNITLESLGLALREKRGGRGLREVAKEVEISPATLSRIETGRQPDLETFSKVCKWLGIDGGEVLGCSNTKSNQSKAFSAHFRAEKTMKPDTATHLGALILAINDKIERENDTL
mgnify:CR=1 FL=1